MWWSVWLRKYNALQIRLVYYALLISLLNVRPCNISIYFILRVSCHDGRSWHLILKCFAIDEYVHSSTIYCVAKCLFLSLQAMVFLSSLRKSEVVKRHEILFKNAALFSVLIPESERVLHTNNPPYCRTKYLRIKFAEGERRKFQWEKKWLICVLAM